MYSMYFVHLCYQQWACCYFSHYSSSGNTILRGIFSQSTHYTYYKCDGNFKKYCCKFTKSHFTKHYWQWSKFDSYCQNARSRFFSHAAYDRYHINLDKIANKNSTTNLTNRGEINCNLIMIIIIITIIRTKTAFPSYYTRHSEIE